MVWRNYRTISEGTIYFNDGSSYYTNDIELHLEAIYKLVGSLDSINQVYIERSEVVPTKTWGDIISASDFEFTVLTKPTIPKIEKIIYNDPATIVWFDDGDKVVVKTHNEEFDEEKGLAMAIIRKLYGRVEFNRLIKNASRQEIKNYLK